MEKLLTIMYSNIKQKKSSFSLKSLKNRDAIKQTVYLLSYSVRTWKFEALSLVHDPRKLGPYRKIGLRISLRGSSNPFSTLIVSKVPAEAVQATQWKIVLSNYLASNITRRLSFDRLGLPGFFLQRTLALVTIFLTCRKNVKAEMCLTK